MTREPDPWATDMNDRLLTEIERLRADQNLAAVACDDLNREIEQYKRALEASRAETIRAVDALVAAKTEIERLQTGWALATKAVDENESLRAEIERLRAALKPFADECVQLSRAHLNGGPDNEEICIAIGWLRAARAALEPMP